ncbi:unnamed protein product [Polarella glacialis]|uniref:Xaa-Pro dipeptidyl-peptidase C-terminal domain-containing protein n=1 Tax=Polarella glacialis TaxID=89957 RepID=A0A813H0G9_POLGL|nr:unnamed protein product [Polarella glacialis]
MLGRARLTVYTGGHFGVVVAHGKQITKDTLAWYDEHLREEGSQSSAAKVRLQVIGAEPGQDWLECDFWPPPPPERSLQFYLSSGDSCQPPATTTGSLELAPRPEQSSAETSSLQYVYDPADPTPYSGGGWLNLQKDGPKDQRSLESQRKEDMLVLTSAPLQESLEVLGEVEVTLFVSCSAAECDLVARLCVVRSGSLEEGDGSTGPLGLLVQLPQTLNRLLDRRELGPGQSLNVCEGLARVNFSQPDADNSNNNNHNTNNNQNKNNEDNKDNNNADNSNNNNSNTTNNNNTNNNNNNDADGPPGFRRVQISLGPTACHFAKGDRVRLHVCSAAHPRWLRHPLQGANEDWLLGSGPLGPPAEVRVLADAARPSSLRLPLRGAAVRTLSSI